MTDFHDLVDTSDLTPEEEARLRRVHDLLIEAGPPPDLPPALEAPPTHPPRPRSCSSRCSRSAAGRSQRWSRRRSR